MMANEGTRAFLMMAFFPVECVSACVELRVPSAYANRQMRAMHFIECERTLHFSSWFAAWEAFTGKLFQLNAYFGGMREVDSIQSMHLSINCHDARFAEWTCAAHFSPDNVFNLVAKMTQNVCLNSVMKCAQIHTHTHCVFARSVEFSVTEPQGLCHKWEQVEN